MDDDFANREIPYFYRCQLYNLLRRAAELAGAGRITTVNDAATIVWFIRSTACSGGRIEGPNAPWEQREPKFLPLVEDCLGDFGEIRYNRLYCDLNDECHPSPPEVFRRPRKATKAAQAGE
jgi:hypothetical protein